MTDDPWRIPKRWRWTKLGEACLETERRDPSKEPGKRFVYVDISSVDNETGQIILPKEMTGAEAPSRARKVIRQGDVIFATTRPYLKNIALVPQALDGQISSTGFCVIRTNPALADPRYIYQVCRSDLVVDQLNTGTMRGASYPAVTDKDVFRTLIPLPATIEEQRRIVAKIEALFDRVREAKRLRVEALADAESLTDAAREEALRGLGTIKFGMLVASYKNGIYKPKHYYGRGYPSVRMFNIGDGKVNLENAPLLDVTGEELDMYGLEPDDVLINRVNSRELVGKSGLIPPGLGPCTFESKNIRVRIKRELAKPAFVVAALNTKSVKQQILGKQKPAIGQATVNQDDLSELQVPFIPDLGEQRRVVAYVDSVAQQVYGLKHRQAETDAELQRLEQSILDRVFRGEL